ncbi:MAG: recombinase family protein, partial [Pirellulales bacterium]
DAGVGVWTASQGNLRLDTATGRIVLTVLSEMENTENATRAFNVLNGILSASSAGYWVSPAPWGYSTKGATGKKELHLSDTHITETIRRIYRQYTAGQSLREIAKQLNSGGISSPNGVQWCGSTIQELLVRPVYCGDHVYNVRSEGKYYQLKGGTLVERTHHWREDGETAIRELNSKADLIYVADRWPAVVDRKTWDSAQSLLAKNRKRTSPSRDYLFSSLLRCQCGGAMQGRKQKTSSKRYRCVKCGATASEAELLEHVTRTIQQQYSPDMISKLRQAMERKLRKGSQQQNGAASKAIQAKLQRYERRLLEVSSDMVQTVEAEIRSLRQQLQEAERSQRAARHACQDTTKRVDQALADFFALPKAIKCKPQADVRRYFQQTIDRIEVQTEIKQGDGRKHYRLAGLEICGSVKPVLSQPPCRCLPP